MKNLIVNATEHDLNIYTGHQHDPILTIPPSGIVVRCEETRLARGTLLYSIELPLTSAQFGDVQNLPWRKEGTYVVVSGIAAQAIWKKFPERTDVVCPGPAVRDEKGKIIGCTGLSVSPLYQTQPR